MGSRTISLDDEAYGLLKEAKLPDESFSDVVKRTLSPTRPKLSDLAGLLSPRQGATIARSLRRDRKESAAADAARDRRRWG